MRRVILEKPRELKFQTIPTLTAADLQDDEILINVKRIGICGSEIHSYNGVHPATVYPIVQGHEYSGIVVAVGENIKNIKLGAHVTGRPQEVCGVCNPCKRGQYNVCSNLKVEAFQANGAAQDYFILPKDRVVVLPEDMSLDYGAMVEPVSVAAHATSRPHGLKGKNVIVSGAGTIGNLIAQYALARGAKKLLITDISDFRLNKAKECGITNTLNVAKKSLEENAFEVFGEEGYQIGFECAGVESSIRSMMKTIEKGGDIVIVGVHAKDPALSMFYLGEHELTLIGSMMYLHQDYIEAVKEIEEGRIFLDPLISNRFCFEDYDKAYKYIDRNKDMCMKVIIDLDYEKE